MISTLPQNRPLLPRFGVDGQPLALVDRVVWAWWLKRLPLLLLAFPSAYGVGRFAASADASMPWAVALIAGVAFEAAYIGAIAIADQLSSTRWYTTALWILVNLSAVLASVACNLLFFSGGRYASITYESATHAIPLPVLAFFYGLLLHLIASDEAQALERKATEAAERCQCPYCNEWFKNRDSRNGHLKNCPQRKG